MTGRVLIIRPTESVQTKFGLYQKREIVLDCTRYDQITGEKGYDNFPSFTFSGEKCALLDNYQEGQIVTVSFDIRGYQGSKGDGAYFNQVRGYKIEARQQQAPQHTQQSQPTSAYPQPKAQGYRQPQQPQQAYQQPQQQMSEAQPTQTYPQQQPVQQQAPYQSQPQYQQNGGATFPQGASQPYDNEPPF